MTPVPGLDQGSLTLALAAGLVAAVNPCGFALLPAYLSLFVLDDAPRSPTAAAGRALRATTALTIGFATVFVAFGLAVAPVAASVQAYLPGFTEALGLFLTLAGLWLLAGHRLPNLPVPRRRKTGPASPVVASWPAMTGFGASYAVASLSCTIAPFLAVVGTSFRSGSPVAGVVLFAAYAAGMGLTVGVVATAVALAREGLMTAMRRAGGIVPRLGGLVLAAAGSYVAWYGAWELRVLHGGAGADPVVSAATEVPHRPAPGSRYSRVPRGSRLRGSPRSAECRPRARSARRCRTWHQTGSAPSPPIRCATPGPPAAHGRCRHRVIR